MSTYAKSKSLAAILIIAGLIIFVVGIFAGFYFEGSSKNSASSQQNLGAEANLVGVLKSSMVSSIIMFGKVQSVVGSTIIIQYDGQTISVAVGGGAKIYSIDPAKGGAQQTASLSDIQPGDNIELNNKITNNDGLVASAVIILAPGVNKGPVTPAK